MPRNKSLASFWSKSGEDKLTHTKLLHFVQNLSNMSLRKLLVALSVLAFVNKVKGDFSDIVLIGDECTDLVSGDDIALGKVCTLVTADTIEVTINMTELSEDCCLRETHICNFPMERVFDDEGTCIKTTTYTFNMDMLSDFMCTDDPCAMFQPDGHATVQCDNTTFVAMYWIMFGCGECPPPCDFNALEIRCAGLGQSPDYESCTCENCTVTCGENEYLTPNCTCSDDPCDACPTGLDCIEAGMGMDKQIFCLDCECGFCRPDTNMTNCCAFNDQNNCNARMMGGLDQCQYMDNYWPSFMTESGQICGGVEISETATEEGCGCKPSSTTLCTYEAETDPCFVCTFLICNLMVAVTVTVALVQIWHVG